MRSRAVVAVALLAGAVIGFGLARLRSPEPQPTPSAAPRSAAGPADSPSSAAATPEAPEAELRRLRQENERLRETLDAARSSPPVADSPAARRERAKSIFESFRRAFVDKEGPELLKAFGAVDELDESTARYFIEQQKAGIENAELRNMNFLLIQLSGGPEAAAFLVDFVRNPNTPAAEREAVLRNLSGTGLPENRKLPYEGAVAETAETLLASANPADRMGGAGLLGGSNGDASRVRLLRMAQSDPDAGVRASALASLGWVGDRAAYERLKGWKAEGVEKTSLERALAQLKRRFPD